MGRVSQRVDPASLLAALAGRGRAWLAFEHAGAVHALPATHHVRDGEHVVGVAAGEWPPDAATARAVLVVDDGRAWFELRAVTLRGRLTPARREDEMVWLTLRLARAIAWDYGALHEEA